MMRQVKIIPSFLSHQLTSANIRLNCARTTLKWVFVLIGRNVNLHMVHKICAIRNHLLKDIIEQEGVDLSGIKAIVIMVSDVNSPTMNVQIQESKAKDF